MTGEKNGVKGVRYGAGMGARWRSRGDRRGDKWGGARPAATRERRKWVSAAVVAREQGRREGGSRARGPQSTRTWAGPNK
jgi:hypothetical protein